MKTACRQLLTLILLLPLTLHAQTATTKTGSLSDVSFMEGRWRGTFNGGPIEAAWIAPVGDNLTGFMRIMKDNKVTMYEMLIFEQTEQGPVVLVRHFKPGLIGQEEKISLIATNSLKREKTRHSSRKKTGRFESSTKSGRPIS